MQRAEHCPYCLLRYVFLTPSKIVRQSFCVCGRGDEGGISGFKRLGDLTGIGGGIWSDNCVEGSFLAAEMGCNLSGISRPILCILGPILNSIHLFAVAVRSSIPGRRRDSIFKAADGYAATQSLPACLWKAYG